MAWYKRASAFSVAFFWTWQIKGCPHLWAKLRGHLPVPETIFQVRLQVMWLWSCLVLDKPDTFRAHVNVEHLFPSPVPLSIFAGARWVWVVGKQDGIVSGGLHISYPWAEFWFDPKMAV